MKVFLRKISRIVLLVALPGLGCHKSNKPGVNNSFICLPDSLQNGIIAFYPFSNGSLNDYSGNGYTLVNATTANPGTDRNGNLDCAFRFIAANRDSLKFTNPSFLNDFHAAPLSISFWYTADGESGGKLISRGSSIPNPRGGTGEWTVALYDNNWPMFFINSRRVIGVTPDPGVVQINEWHHIVVTSDHTDLKVYQDGVLIGDIETIVCNCTPAMSENTGDFIIGGNFSGRLDDIILYNRLLSSGEISALYNLPACCE